MWEFCDRIPFLPKNNVEAVTELLVREERLIGDALEELEQVQSPTTVKKSYDHLTTKQFLQDCQHTDSDVSVEDSDDDSEVILGVALELLPPLKGLLKSSRAILRRTKKMLAKPAIYVPVQLDAYVEQVPTLSSVVDDLVCSLYAPVNPSLVSEHGHLLISKLSQMLETSKEIAGEEDEQWIELYSRAIQRKLQDLQTILTNKTVSDNKSTI